MQCFDLVSMIWPAIDDPGSDETEMERALRKRNASHRWSRNYASPLFASAGEGCFAVKVHSIVIVARSAMRLRTNGKLHYSVTPPTNTGHICFRGL